MTDVALLRGINVGGKHRLSMRDLVEMFGAAGCADVRTYIQSGNVVFTSTGAVAGRLERIVRAMIGKRFGVEPAIVVRRAPQMASIAEHNPFLKSGADVSTLHVGFLHGEPDPRRIAELDSGSSPGDRFEFRGGEIYLHLPNGVLKSRLTGACFDSVLLTQSTFRNWRTVLKLTEMTAVGP